MIKEDYAEVGVPMLPVVEGEEATVKQIWIYSLLVVPCSLLLMYPIGNLTILYGAIALYLGYKFLYKAWELKQDPTYNQLARGMFKYSIFYMMLLCVAMIVDTLPVTHQLMNMVFPCGG